MKSKLIGMREAMNRAEIEIVSALNGPLHLWMERAKTAQVYIRDALELNANILETHLVPEDDAAKKALARPISRSSDTADGKAKFDRIAYRVTEFAGMLGVSRGFLYLERDRGNLAINRVAGRALILREEAERYVRENLGSAAGE